MVSGSRNKHSFTFTASRKKIEKILAATSEKPCSRAEIEKIANMSYSGIRVYISHLLETKQIYISQWKFEKQGDRTMQWPYYSAGNKKNKEKPKPLSDNEKCRRYREKLKKDEDKKDKINAKRRLKRRDIKLQPELQIWISRQESFLSGQSKTE